MSMGVSPPEFTDAQKKQSVMKEIDYQLIIGNVDVSGSIGHVFPHMSMCLDM